MTCYDADYIDAKIIGGIEKNLPAVSDIIRYIEKKATGKITSTLSTTSSVKGDDQDSQVGMSVTHSVLN